MECNNQKNAGHLLGKTVYHRDLYDFREPFKVTGVTLDSIELEGDYSGGTHQIIQKQWKKLTGTSVVYNYRYKEECRKKALTIDALAIPLECAPKRSNAENAMLELKEMVLVLTNDVAMNPEYK